MNKLLLSCLVFASSTVFAADATEFYYRPGAGKQAVDLAYEMGNAPVSSTTTDKTADLTARYLYGIQEGLAAGISLRNGTITSETGGTSSTSSGLADPHLVLLGNSDFIYWGADLGIALEKAKGTNRATGGHSLQGEVGALFSGGGFNYGADLSYTYGMERSFDSSGVTGKITGGNVLTVAAFGEYNYGGGIVTASLGILQMSDFKAKPDTGSEVTTKGETDTIAKIGVVHGFTEMIGGFASYQMTMHPEVTDNSTKAYTASDITVGARFVF